MIRLANDSNDKNEKQNKKSFTFHQTPSLNYNLNVPNAAVRVKSNLAVATALLGSPFHGSYLVMIS